MQCQSIENTLPFKEKKGMTRIGRRLVEDFLLPALNDERYGDLLKWTDKDNLYFKIRWSHKNAAKWSHEDTIVFQDWDKLKGHYHPEIKGYYMQAKQRFRAALYKLNSVKNLHCEDKHVKKYQLLLDPEKRKLANQNKVNSVTKCSVKKFNEEDVEENRTKHLKKYQIMVENERKRIQYFIDEKVDENPSRDSCIMYPAYVGNHIPLFYAPPSTPSSDSEKSDSSDNTEYASCIHDYKIGQKNHNKMIYYNNYSTSPKKESPLREVNDDSIRGPKWPYVPLPQVPVYGAPSKRFESPRVLLVKTYNEICDTKDVYNPEEVVCDPSPDYVLNLSVKSDESR